jgi:Cytochrome c
MLKALTAIFVAIAVVFVAWSFLVMTGGRDWLAANMTAADQAPEKVAAKEEPPKQDQAEPAKAEPAKADAEQAEPADAEETVPANADAEETAPDAAMKDEAKDESKDEAAATAEAGGEAAGAGVDPAGNPAETAEAAEKGSLKSPYQESYDKVAEEGHKKYMSAGCNGCHGGTGGGGMGPPLSNPVWVYGNDGDTLFRLIALGSDGLQAQGYTRKGSENVVGPMPPHGTIVKSNDDLWKIIGWIWSINPPDKS